ncbi:MAG: GNAT family N-acetyltransferase [Bacteroidales bacterium]|nr:GNAT family N-acetyltransferase [Bacteroidales bacterium]
MIRIERLKEEYLQGLQILYADAFGSKTDKHKMIATFKRIRDNPDYIILCALEDTQVVGSVLGVVCQELIGQGTPFMVLEDVAVLSSHRRKGIAKQLMLAVEEQANARSCNMILFVSSAHREEAHRLYESLGYGKDQVNGYRKRLA